MLLLHCFIASSSLLHCFFFFASLLHFALSNSCWSSLLNLTLLKTSVISLHATLLHASLLVTTSPRHTPRLSPRHSPCRSPRHTPCNYCLHVTLLVTTVSTSLLSYEEEDTYVSYEEEDTYVSYEDHCVHVTTVSTSDSCPQTGGEGFVLASSVTLVQPQNCFSNYSSVTLALDDHRVPFMTIACHSSPVGIHLSRNRKCRRQRAAALGQVTHEPKCLLPGFPSHTHTHINTLGFALTHL